MEFKLSLVVVFVWSFWISPISASPEVVSEADFRVEILKLNHEFLHIAESQTRNARVALFALGGYALGTSFGWWLGLEGAGPWVFTSVFGAGAGVFAAVIPPEIARTQIWRRKALCRLRSLLRSQTKPRLSYESIAFLSECFHILHHELLLRGFFLNRREQNLLLDVFEAFLDFQYLYVNFSTDETEVYTRHRATLEDSLKDMALSLSLIEAHSSHHKSFRVLQRSLTIKESLLGVWAQRKREESWEDWQAWLRTEGLGLESAQELAEKELQRARERLWLRAPLKIRREDKRDSPFSLRLVSREGGAPELLVYPRFYESFSETILLGDLGLILEKLSQNGVWIRWNSLGPSFWEYYRDQDSLPFSERQSFGEIEVSLNPYRHDASNFRLEIESVLQARELRQNFRRPRLLKQTCSILVARLRERLPVNPQARDI